MSEEPLVLLLDDDCLIASITGECLEDKGFAVITAGGAADALRVVDEINERLSALFLDIHLKDGATSFEVATAARRRFAGIPVLYTSGLPDAADDAQCVPGGRFIAKPYDTAAVAGVLRAMIVGSGREARRLPNGAARSSPAETSPL